MQHLADHLNIIYTVLGSIISIAVLIVALHSNLKRHIEQRLTNVYKTLDKLERRFYNYVTKQTDVEDDEEDK